MADALLIVFIKVVIVGQKNNCVEKLDKNFMYDFFKKFRIGEHQETQDVVWDSKFLKTKSDIDVFNRIGAADDAVVDSTDIGWFVPIHVPVISEDAIQSMHIITKTTNELRYLQRSVSAKSVRD